MHKQKSQEFFTDVLIEEKKSQITNIATSRQVFTFNRYNILENNPIVGRVFSPLISALAKFMKIVGENFRGFLMIEIIPNDIQERNETRRGEWNRPD